MSLRRLTLFMLALTLTATAQQSLEKNFVRASADATVTAEPNRAQIAIGVRTQAATAKAAAQQNAVQTSEVLKSMKSILGSKGKVQTRGYSISPHYESTGTSNRQSGYETSNTVEVTVDDLTLLPQLIDASSGSGANSMGGISFSLKDDSTQRLQALAEASKKAKAAAEAMAQALNLRVVGVASAEAGMGGSPIRPMMQSMVMSSYKAAPTPIESGTLDIHATATVTLEVSR
jgi:uncharacterized protein YggE